MNSLDLYLNSVQQDNNAIEHNEIIENKKQKNEPTNDKSKTPIAVSKQQLLDSNDPSSVMNVFKNLAY